MKNKAHVTLYALPATWKITPRKRRIVSKSLAGNTMLMTFTYRREALLKSYIGNK